MMSISIRREFHHIIRSYSSLFLPRKTVQSSTMSISHSTSIMTQKYSDAIRDLNALQSNHITVQAARYNDPKVKLATFKQQIDLAGMCIKDFNKLNILHVGGTKGKGSTCVFIDNILRNNGVKTGFYNSPHLIEVNERIQINGHPLSHEKFTQYFYDIYDKLKDRCRLNGLDLPSYFSFLTIMAFHVFIKEKVDCALIEVGIGGEYDPTNVIEKPIACGITTLDYDHTNMLGNKIESIAKTKAGICKPSIPLFTVNQKSYEATLDVISAKAQQVGSTLYICQSLINLGSHQLGIKGDAQLDNASLACHMSNYFLSIHKPESRILSRSYEESSSNRSINLDCDFEKLPKTFQYGLMNSSWPGRCQIVKMSSNLLYYLDGAHTLESMKNCLRWFEISSNNSTEAVKILLVNIVGDRNREEILKPLVKYRTFDYVIFSSNIVDIECHNVGDDTYFSDKRNHMISNMHMNVEAWSNIKETSIDTQETKLVSLITVRESLLFIRKLVDQDSGKKFDILVTGSLHFVGTVLKGLKSGGFEDNGSLSNCQKI